MEVSQQLKVMMPMSAKIGVPKTDIAAPLDLAEHLANLPDERHMLRSISVREKRSLGGLVVEKRRSISYDETNGEIMRKIAASAIPEEEKPESPPPGASNSSKTSSWWNAKMWKFGKGRRRSAQNEHESTVSTQKISLGFGLGPDQTVPKWKKMFQKIKAMAPKSATCTSSVDVVHIRFQQPGLFLKTGSIRRTAPQPVHLSSQGPPLMLQKLPSQKPSYCVHPEPPPRVTPVVRVQTRPPIWERRNYAPPSTLDLSNVKITGWKNFQKP